MKKSNVATYADAVISKIALRREFSSFITFTFIVTALIYFLGDSFNLATSFIIATTGFMISYIPFKLLKDNHLLKIGGPLIIFYMWIITQMESNLLKGFVIIGPFIIYNLYHLGIISIAKKTPAYSASTESKPDKDAVYANKRANSNREASRAEPHKEQAEQKTYTYSYTYEDFQKVWEQSNSKNSVNSSANGSESPKSRYTQQENQRTGNGNSTTKTDEYSEALKFFGLSRNFTASELRKKRNAFLKKYHPDLGGSEEMTVKINRYYEILHANSAA